MRRFTADFETTTDENDCRVWAYAICEIGNINNFIYGNNIDDFIEFCMKKENYVLYFHNLKFDAEYIIYYLLKNGYTCIKDKKDRKDKTFVVLISEMGQFYSLEIYFKVGNKKHINKVTIYDSLKILNFSVDKIAKDFNLPIRKLELDYHEKREIGHELTEHEINYIRNDVEIMARALEIMFQEKLNKMTIGSDALAFYKELNPNFENYFPILPYEIDAECRKAYKGGFTYLNPIFKGKETGAGIVFDKNSMYPAKMKNEKLPFGVPIYFKGKYKQDNLYNLYIQTFSCSFKLKNNKIPSIQIKNNLAFVPNEYIESTNGDIVTLTLTSVDLELFFENYEIYDITYHSGFKFKSIKGLFTTYIDYWTEKKINAKKEDNGALYKIAKLMLNSLYGKFGLNPRVRGKYPILENDVVKYKFYDEEIRDSIYVPVASFITAYARKDIIESSEKIREYSLKKYEKDLYIYSDTDSIHCLLNEDDIEELKSTMDIDDYILGYWKLESKFKRGKFLRQKCYIEENEENEIQTTIAGLPKKLGKYITFNNFVEGFSILADDDDEYEHKLRFKHVKGGVLLVDTDFTIKG